MKLNIGILIIGSLLWDNINDRDSWRKRRLINEPISVHAPIRYGRKSIKRGSYTMVFSSAAPLGQAKILPCKNNDSDLLIEEANELWTAEDNVAGCISSSWGGCTVLCVNPEREIPVSVLKNWTDQVAEEPTTYAKFPKSPDDDRQLVTTDGFLNIWPTRSDGADLDFDLLLATANYPFSIGSPVPYPEPDAIAKAWKARTDQLYYFNGNCANGIRTFQDDLIALCLSPE